MDLKRSEIFFNALADRTRLRVLNLLGGGELCVCDLMRVLKEPQSKVSRHLSYLRRAKLVEARKKGLWMSYRLADPGVETFRAVLKSLRRGRADFAQLRNDRDEYERSKSCLVACCA